MVENDTQLIDHLVQRDLFICLKNMDGKGDRVRDLLLKFIEVWDVRKKH